MKDVLDFAQYICDRYHSITDDPIDEMKLHKLLYFCQREKLAILNEPMFTEHMQGWVHGPVSLRTRTYFDSTDGIIQLATNDISDEDKYIINNVLEQYAGLASWKLRDLSHEEYSWQHSREGLAPDERGSKGLLLDDIRHDAKKVRPIDSVWGMYYDEFEDFEVAE